MKKLLFLVIAILTLSSSAADMRRGNFPESLGWQQGDTLLVIPASVKAIPAFGCADMTDLREVRIEPGSKLTKIGEYAFMGCSALHIINLPSGLGDMQQDAFMDCTGLESISLPNSLTSLPAEAFRGCTSLRSVRFPSRLASIGKEAFIYCESLESIDLPKSLKKIGDNAFSGCNALKEVSIPDGVTSLGCYAFSHCEGLERFRLPRNSAQLGEQILSGCSAIRHIEAPNPTPPAFECDSYLLDPRDPEDGPYPGLTVSVGSRATYVRAPHWRHLLDNSQP